MKNVLVDVSWLAYRASFSIQNLSHNDIPTGIIFGFLNQILSISFHPKVASNQLSLFLDSSSSYRRTVYPAYKGKRRDRTDKELAVQTIMHQQIDLMKEALPKFGFKLFKQNGLESDDLIAQAALQLQAWDIPEPKAVIITADQDLLQCVTDNVHWFDPSRDKYFDAQAVWREKGVAPDQFAMVKAYAGCDGDNVAGITGVGERTAADFLAGLLNEKHKRCIAIRENGEKMLAINLPLVKLPHAKTRPVNLQSPKYQPEKFYEFLKELGMESFLTGSLKQEWDMFFSGNMSGIRTRKKGE